MIELADANDSVRFDSKYQLETDTFYKGKLIPPDSGNEYAAEHHSLHALLGTKGVESSGGTFPEGITTNLNVTRIDQDDSQADANINNSNVDDIRWGKTKSNDPNKPRGYIPDRVFGRWSKVEPEFHQFRTALQKTPSPSIIRPNFEVIEEGTGLSNAQALTLETLSYYMLLNIFQHYSKEFTNIVGTCAS